MIYVIGFLFFAIIGSVFGSNSGKKGIGFALGLFLGPIGWIIALYLKTDSEKLEEIKRKTENLKNCPNCAELVKKEASVCKHCGNDLTATLKEEPIKFDEILKVEKRENVKKLGDGDYPYCENCHGRISRLDKRCSHCGSTFE
jgi:predicted amidophosphoribosyltransferase